MLGQMNGDRFVSGDTTISLGNLKSGLYPKTTHQVFTFNDDRGHGGVLPFRIQSFLIYSALLFCLALCFYRR